VGIEKETAVGREYCYSRKKIEILLFFPGNKEKTKKAGGQHIVINRIIQSSVTLMLF